MSPTPIPNSAPLDPAPLFRDGMARLGAAVTILTTDGPAGRAGMTASAVTSVSDSPPTLLACINRTSHLHPVFRANGVLCVNVLAAGQEALSRLFADRGACMDTRFTGVATQRLATGSAALDGALVNFDCRVTAVHDVGSHAVFFAEVAAIRLGPAGPGLGYFERTYQRLGDRT